MSPRPLRVCIVGCGDMGRTHARCWSQLPEAQVVAVVDILEERAHHLSSTLGLERFYKDYREAIDLPEVNIVSVCVPTCLHQAVTIYAAQRSRHVLTEKPIALDLQQADSMLETVRRFGIHFSVGLMRYHSPVMAELKRWLNDGRLNRPAVYWASDIREIRPKLEMHDVAANGGPVIDMAVHLFATWHHLFSALPQEVTAHGFTFAQQRPELASIAHKALDTATISVRFQSGDIGNFLVSWGVPPGVIPTPIPEMLLTSTGVVHAIFSPNQQQARLLQEGGEWLTISTSDENMYMREIRDFASSILEERPPLVSGEQGRLALQVSLAALESIRLQAPVHLNI